MPSTAQVTRDRAAISWYDRSAMELPACPECRKASAVALLSKIEKGRRTAQTWICRNCLSSFGEVDEWRRQIRKSELLSAGIAIAAAVGVSVLILRRKARNSIRARQQPTLRSHTPAFV